MSNRYNNRRRQFYVDRVLQGRFLLGLIGLEVLLIGVGLVVVYQNMNAAVEMQLFQAHAPSKSDSSLLISELSRVMPWILIANVVAVLIANRIWAGYISSIISDLRQMLGLSAKLDFRDLSGQIEGNHEVLIKGLEWMRRERERNQELKALFAQLKKDTDPSEAKKILGRAKDILS